MSAAERLAAAQRAEREAVEQSELDRFDLLRNFPVYTPTFQLGRFLTHYEVFRKILPVPGAIVELGVLCGASLMTWARLCQLFCPRDFRRTVFGFDTFSGFPALSAEDGVPDAAADKRAGGYDGSHGHAGLRRALAALEAERVSEVPRVRLVAGDVRQTVPRFAAENPSLTLSLLHLDLDLFEPTLCALEHLYPRVARGGIVLIDEIDSHEFPGAMRAVEEYFAARGLARPRLEHFPWHNTEPAYFVVD
jgi:Macrocin-O-methyltransferase (TylF)